ncbi:unnamed protein product [Effrenium voratum]|nr:unnamed protein product [Effrenium voratum]CAJ1441649.1 unnamed protein product [Effrenium voratum]
MDGHGGQGIMKRSLDLQQGLLNACRVAADWPKCAREAVQNFQDRARQMQYRGGATLLALLTEERSSRVAFAWAGDSMAILVKQGRTAFRTSLHTTELESEVQRIRGHPEYKYEFHDGYLCSTDPGAGCVMPTRGLGDVDLEPAGFLAVPDTSEFMDLAPGDFVLMASDGLWDVLSEEEVLARTQVGSPEKNLATAEALAEAAVQGWARRYGPGEADDVSLLLCQPVGEEKAEL